MRRGVGAHNSRSAPLFLSGVLDKLSVSPAAAYGLRRLRRGYGGSAINVRRSSDNAAMDVGFDAAGNLAVAALLAFVGSGTGYVTTWYDQSTNGLHATQAIATSQPVIVSSGTLLLVNTRPAMTFPVAPLTTSPFPSGVSQFSANAIVQPSTTSSASGQRILAVVPAGQDNDYSGDGAVIPLIYDANSTAYIYRNLHSRLSAQVSAGGSVLSGWFDAQNVNFAVNGVLQSAAYPAAPLGSPVVLYVGGTVSNSPFQGQIGEACWFHSALSTADRQILEQSQENYITVSGA